MIYLINTMVYHNITVVNHGTSCNFTYNSDNLFQNTFEYMSSSHLKKKQKKKLLQDLETLEDSHTSQDKPVLRHAGVLGYSACIRAFPYDVPDGIPDILMKFTEHLDGSQPIQV